MPGGARVRGSAGRVSLHCSLGSPQGTHSHLSPVNRTESQVQRGRGQRSSAGVPRGRHLCDHPVMDAQLVSSMGEPLGAQCGREATLPLDG